MKKNITINLCGRLFQIDEDAYELLRQYIDSLRQSFGREEGGEEIVGDIEARIAELFDELRQQGTEAITIDHVKNIITRIGKPEQLYGDCDSMEEECASSETKEEGKTQTNAERIMENMRTRVAGKRLYRNPNDKMLAGVLSGFAAYTGTDVTWWRVGYVLLILGSNLFLEPLFRLLFHGGFMFTANIGFVLLYFVLAIAMPTANTPKQVLEMEGKDVTPQNLADVVIDEKQQEPRRSFLGSMFSVLLKIMFAIFVGIAAICGLMLLVCLFLIVVSIVVVFTVPTASRLSLPFDIGYLNLPELYAGHPWVVAAFIVGLVLALFVPVYAIAHMLLSKAGKVQPMGIGQRIAWIVVWLAALCGLVPSFIWVQDKAENLRMAEYRRTHSYQGVTMSNEDRDFLRRGGWTLLKHENCAHYTYSGDYYNGNEDVRYLDAWNENCKEVYQAERKQVVEPGIYRLDCLARAEGPGPCIYVLGDKKYLKEIPAYGDTGGELVDSIQRRLPEVAEDLKKRSKVSLKFFGMEIEINDEQLDFDDEDTSKARVKEGLGWSVVSIENIVVTDGTIAYGVSTDAAFTGHPCRAQWFSATDFTLTRTGDLKLTGSR
ncbi:MAG: PspC domain-containing protein [Prevotella sp.]|nr:PspC domain-containing protein [Prevotella sp.]